VKHWIAAVLKQKCARMHQILFQFFFQGSPQDPRHWGLCPQTAGEGRGEERERGRRGREREEEVCVIAVGG